jgi:hypothetical protein
MSILILQYLHFLNAVASYVRALKIQFNHKNAKRYHVQSYNRPAFTITVSAASVWLIIKSAAVFVTHRDNAGSI